MGESGGGMKISTLLAMEEAKGLFAQAIIESGSNVVGTYTKGQATQDALKRSAGLSLSDHQRFSLPRPGDHREALCMAHS